MSNRSQRRMACVALIVAVVVGLSACLTVTPRVPFETWEFEGFQVVSYVPDDPAGIAHLFHGTGGSAAFATKVETTDTINELIDRGYGFVATESTERTGNKRWNVFDPSPTTNPDLSRLERLQQHLIDTTPVTSTTPLVGVGMSNGARFVSLWGQTWADAGYPVEAIAMYMGTIAPPVRDGDGLTVPTFFVAAENDFTVPPDLVVDDHDTTAALGTPTELVVAEAQPLSRDRFLRIPGIDEDEADGTFDALVATGSWDELGARLVSIADAVAGVAAADFPDSVQPQRTEIVNQCALVLAVHQMRGDVKASVGEFFDTHIGA